MADQRDSEVEVRLVVPGDDLDAQLDLAERAFGVKNAGDRDRWRETVSALIAQRQCLGAFAGGRPAAGAMFHDMRQWWCGRPVPMAGVSSVRVAPEDRGQGIGRLLMTALLEEMAARGYPLSVLYPATMPLYRSLGWELAGGQHTAVIPARSLFRLSSPDPASCQAGQAGKAAGPGRSALRRVGRADVDAALSVLDRVYQDARACGPITWDRVGRWLADPDVYAYLCEDGFLAYRWSRGNDDLVVEVAQALSAATVRAFWSHLGGYGSIAGKIHARVGPADAFWWLARERDADVVHRSLWMLRVIDAPAAIAARGFRAAVSLAVPLLIADDARPANSGHWDLTVAGGKGSLTPAPSPRARAAPARPTPQAPLAVPALLTLGARGLAALYAGTPLVTLRQAGLVSGGSPDDDAALDAAFAATPYMLDEF
jgi:predicted acetyltransferase